MDLESWAGDLPFGSAQLLSIYQQKESVCKAIPVASPFNTRDCKAAVVFDTSIFKLSGPHAMTTVLGPATVCSNSSRITGRLPYDTFACPDDVIQASGDVGCSSSVGVFVASVRPQNFEVLLVHAFEHIYAAESAALPSKLSLRYNFKGDYVIR